jgi:hypothetical protein
MAKNPNPNVLDFEPSQNTKNLWLATRKAGKQVTANLTLPGLFETVKYSQDKSLFGIAMVLEVIGCLLISALADWGLLIAGTVAALVMIDVFLAIGLHYKQGKICFHLNMAITTAANQGVQAGHINRVRKLKNWWLGKICIVLLWVFAVIKASAFYVLNPDTYIYGILMFLIYSFIAYVHIYHTGYFLSEYRFRRAFSKEEDKFKEWQIDGITVKSPKVMQTIIPNCREYPLQPDNLQLQEIQYVKGADKDGKRANIVICDNSNWKLITWGMMDDADLHNLLSGNDKIRAYLAVECLKAQLDMLNKGANVAVGPTLVAIQSILNSTQIQQQ